MTLIIPNNVEKIEKQIKALEYQLSQDIGEKDKCIHQKSIELLRQALEVIK